MGTVIQAAGTAHLRVHTRGSFNLAQFNAVSHVLDLAVFPPQKDQFAPVIVLAQIAGAVDDIGFSGFWTKAAAVRAESR